MQTPSQTPTQAPSTPSTSERSFNPLTAFLEEQWHILSLSPPSKTAPAHTHQTSQQYLQQNLNTLTDSHNSALDQISLLNAQLAATTSCLTALQAAHAADARISALLIADQAEEIRHLRASLAALRKRHPTAPCPPIARTELLPAVCVSFDSAGSTASSSTAPSDDEQLPRKTNVMLIDDSQFAPNSLLHHSCDSDELSCAIASTVRTVRRTASDGETCTLSSLEDISGEEVSSTSTASTTSIVQLCYAEERQQQNADAPVSVQGDTLRERASLSDTLSTESTERRINDNGKCEQPVEAATASGEETYAVDEANRDASTSVRQIYLSEPLVKNGSAWTAKRFRLAAKYLGASARRGQPDCLRRAREALLRSHVWTHGSSANAEGRKGFEGPERTKYAPAPQSGIGINFDRDKVQTTE